MSLQEAILNYVYEIGLNVVCAHLGYQNANALLVADNQGDDEVKRYINDIKNCKKHGINLIVMHPTKEYDDPGISKLV